MAAKKLRTRRAPGDATGEDASNNRIELGSLLGEWAGSAEKCVREQPFPCVGFVFAVGLLASMLPFGRFFLGIIRPVLLVAGVIKVLEEVERRREAE